MPGSIDFAGLRQVFLDMDGTIYEGDHLYECTLPFLNFLKSRNVNYAFITNNSSFSTPEYVEKLTRMQVPAAAENFYTSTDFAIDYLKTNHPEIKRIYWFGMPKPGVHFQEAGFELVDENTIPDAVILGFDRDVTYPKLCRSSYLIQQGIPGFATHPDPVCPSDKPTCLIDCGAITHCIEYATGKKLTVLGKPNAEMLRLAAARRHVTIDQCLMVGDRLKTDIAVGRNSGAYTAWISPVPCGDEVPETGKPHVNVKDLGVLQEMWENAVK